VLAAHRAGLKTVILPQRNTVDIDELPEEVRSEMTFVTVDRIDQAIAIAFADQAEAKTSDNDRSLPESGDGDECDTDLMPLAC